MSGWLDGWMVGQRVLDTGYWMKKSAAVSVSSSIWYAASSI